MTLSRAMLFTLLLPSLISCGNLNPQILSNSKPLHDDAEKQFRASYLSLATGRLKDGAPRQTYAWPFEALSIGHTMSSYQNYGGDPYFHHGLDIRGDADLDVLASAGGKVVNIENYFPGSPAYWEVAILDDQGFLWQYHHIERRSIPEEVWEAYRNKTSIAQGTKLGEIYYWSVVTYGERYHHVHLNILDADGNYLNPFSFLEDLGDQQTPKIEEVGILKNGRRWTNSTVSGQYTLYAKVHDLILHDKFSVPPYEITYSVDGTAPKTVWRFDNLPGGSSNERYVDEFFNPSLTCGNYQCRELAVDLGFKKDGIDYFTTEAGSHSVKIEARDFAGNTTSTVFNWQVQ